jgi:hypothetical protein
MAQTRRQLRQSIARMLNDYHTATAAGAGETGQLTDLHKLARESDYFKGMQVVFTDEDSPNYLHMATVTRSDGPTRTIFFEPPVSGSIPSGDVVDLYNFRGRGSTYDQYNDHINDAIRVARDLHALVPMTVEGEDAYNYQTRRIAVPDELVSLAYVTFTETHTGRRRKISSRDMTVDRLSREVVFGSYAYGWNGYTPTFVGYGMPDLLEDDDDTTEIEAEWLFNEVKAQILERQVASGMPVGSQDRLYLQERTEAGGKRPMIITRALPNTVRLR